MERLTKRDSKGRVYFDNDGVLLRGANGVFHQKKDMTAHYIHDRFVALDKALDRLAAYEDIGLAPEGIKERLEAYKELFFERADLYNEIGSIEHIRDLAQAEKDGRLVVLPPNAPLTPEELREMDGPVWWFVADCDWILERGYWCLCQHGKIVVPSGNRFDCDNIPDWIFYRRKPEEVTT